MQSTAKDVTPDAIYLCLKPEQVAWKCSRAWVKQPAFLSREATRRDAKG